VSTAWGRRLQYAAACLLVIAYDGLSHYSNATGAHQLGAALALTPTSLVLLIVAWRSTPPAIALLLSAALGTVLFYVWPLLAQKFSLFYLIQETSVYGLLGLTFSRSLRHNKIALCTQLADRLHGPLSPREVRYTRRVTLAWALFFFAVSSVSVLLYVAAPLRTWSVYINFCVLPLIAAMFVAEYLVRRRVLPQVKRVGIIASVRAYFASPRYREHGH
jgi:uncharacterized membrane protein